MPLQCERHHIPLVSFCPACRGEKGGGKATPAQIRAAKATAAKRRGKRLKTHVMDPIAEPGTPAGACLDSLCRHPRCHYLRTTAAIGCYRCGRPIGYRVLFRLRGTGGRGPHHVLCPA